MLVIGTKISCVRGVIFIISFLFLMFMIMVSSFIIFILYSCAVFVNGLLAVVQAH